MTTTTPKDKLVEDAEYEAAYKRYLQAFIQQLGPSTAQEKQPTILLTLATALGVRDGNRSLKNGEGEALPIGAQGFRVRAQALLGLNVGRDPEGS